MAVQQQHKPGAPVVGFNHNMNYKNRTFHVQTEDSGSQHAHIITHIFLGGNILASTKSSYADVLVGLDPNDIFATVRKLMEDQHKAMMKSLVTGTHDAEIDRRTGVAVYEPGVLAGGARAPGLLVGGDKKPGEATPAPAKAAPVAPPKAAPVAPAPAPKPAPKAPAAPVAARPPAKPAAPPAEFGEGLVSGKSLDEVILAYLAADLEGSKR